MSLDNIDRLSRLPEEISSHILSLMPTKFAVRTSILSTRWRYTWTSVTNLHFEHLNPDTITPTTLDDNQPIGSSENFPNFVDRVLDFCRSPQIQLFRLHLLDSCASRESISNWIDKAARLNVCELDIQSPTFELPLSFLTCKTLIKLKLDCHFDGNLFLPPCQPDLPFLKTLDIVVSNSFVGVFKLINGCPILESLSLEVECREDKGDYIFNLPTLRRLKLMEKSAIWINKVILRVPNLEYLFVAGLLSSHFVMEDVPALVEASVLFDEAGMDYLWCELLKGLYGVKSFSAQISIFLYLERPFIWDMCIFLNMEHLELKGFYPSEIVYWLLEISPNLKHLCIEKPDEGFSWTKEEAKVHFCWTKLELVPSCVLTGLVTIKFSECNCEKDDMKFLKYMLGNAEVLKTVTISWKNLSTEEQLRFGVEVLNFPRASTHCEIYFL